jgi:hypothetical protein
VVVGPTATASSKRTSIPSVLSWKSMPSCSGSKIGLVSTSPVESLSMMRFGGVRPPSPMTSGAIVAVWSLGVALAPLISVTERLSGP